MAPIYIYMAIGGAVGIAGMKLLRQKSGMFIWLSAPMISLDLQGVDSGQASDANYKKGETIEF